MLVEVVEYHLSVSSLELPETVLLIGEHDVFSLDFGW